MESFGVVFVFVYPLIAVLSPLFGMVSIIMARSEMLRLYQNVNAAVCLVNLPLFIFGQMVQGDEIYYLLIVVVVIMLKCCISFTCSTIRA